MPKATAVRRDEIVGVKLRCATLIRARDQFWHETPSAWILKDLASSVPVRHLKKNIVTGLIRKAEI